MIVLNDSVADCVSIVKTNRKVNSGRGENSADHVLQNNSVG
ncbi:hypothetical protein EC9_25270 [Rosistilla ulvae]|uniref:Uncharacterized protein n=1 Tax=Rosistilla ulvae TaxID=1930277 RepID=A0A517M0E0_9BACT|nr:hypothetical protein EC9_25270 [Rosistilla ulvae]